MNLKIWNFIQFNSEMYLLSTLFLTYFASFLHTFSDSIIGAKISHGFIRNPYTFFPCNLNFRFLLNLRSVVTNETWHNKEYATTSAEIRSTENYFVISFFPFILSPRINIVLIIITFDAKSKRLCCSSMRTQFLDFRTLNNPSIPVKYIKSTSKRSQLHTWFYFQLSLKMRFHGMFSTDKICHREIDKWLKRNYIIGDLTRFP